MLKLFRGKKQEWTKAEIKRSKPQRNPLVEWQDAEDGAALLHIPVNATKGISGLVAKSLKVDDKKMFELEPVGAFVWRHCDGRRTCAEIASLLQNEYKITRVEAEASLMAFLQTLGVRKLIRLEKPTK